MGESVLRVSIFFAGLSPRSPIARYAKRMKRSDSLKLARARTDVVATVHAELARARKNATTLQREYGATPSYWSRRLNGRIPFTADDLDRVAEHCGIDPAVLMGGIPYTGIDLRGGIARRVTRGLLRSRVLPNRANLSNRKVTRGILNRQDQDAEVNDHGISSAIRGVPTIKGSVAKNDPAPPFRDWSTSDERTLARDAA